MMSSGVCVHARPMARQGFLQLAYGLPLRRPCFGSCPDPDSPLARTVINPSYPDPDSPLTRNCLTLPGTPAGAQITTVKVKLVIHNGIPLAKPSTKTFTQQITVCAVGHVRVPLVLPECKHNTSPLACVHHPPPLLSPPNIPQFTSYTHGPQGGRCRCLVNAILSRMFLQAKSLLPSWFPS